MAQNVVVNILSNFRGEAAFKNVQKSLERLGPLGKRASAGLDSVVGRFTKMGVEAELAQSAVVAGAGAAVAGVVALGAEMVAAANAASDLNEQINATKVTFGSAADEVLAFGETTADAMGISNRAALEAAQAFGGVFTNIGFSEAAAADLSKGMVQLAADLASLKNLSTDEALAKLQSGLAGEIEPLRRLGVDVSEAAVKAAAAEKGLTGELNQGEKVAIRYELIMRQLAEAQGDFARTSDSLANQQRVLNASIEDLQANIGKLSAPVLKVIARDLNLITDAADKAAGGVGGLDNVIEFLADAVISAPLSGFTKDAGDAAEAAGTYEQALAALTIEGLHNAETAEEQREAAEKLGKAWEELPDKILDIKDAHLGLAEAHDRVRDAEEDLNDERTVTAKEAEKITEATEDLAEAQKDLAELQSTEVVRAERAVAEARRDSARAANALQDAESDLKDAQAEVERVVGDPAATPRQVAKAKEDLADAELGVAEAQADAQESSESVEEALRQQREGTDELKRATEQVTAAQKDLDRVRADSIGTADEQEAAERRLEQAKLGVERATRAIDKAEKDLATTRAETVDNMGLPEGFTVNANGPTSTIRPPGVPAPSTAVTVNVNGPITAFDPKAVADQIADRARLIALTLT